MSTSVHMLIKGFIWPASNDLAFSRYPHST